MSNLFGLYYHIGKPPEARFNLFSRVLCALVHYGTDLSEVAKSYGFLIDVVSTLYSEKVGDHNQGALRPRLSWAIHVANSNL